MPDGWNCDGDGDGAGWGGQFWCRTGRALGTVTAMATAVSFALFMFCVRFVTFAFWCFGMVYQPTDPVLFMGCVLLEYGPWFFGMDATLLLFSICFLMFCEKLLEFWNCCGGRLLFR